VGDFMFLAKVQQLMVSLNAIGGLQATGLVI
jgi:hypothetical protein